MFFYEFLININGKRVGSSLYLQRKLMNLSFLIKDEVYCSLCRLYLPSGTSILKFVLEESYIYRIFIQYAKNIKGFKVFLSTGWSFHKYY